MLSGAFGHPIFIPLFLATWSPSFAPLSFLNPPQDDIRSSGMLFLCGRDTTGTRCEWAHSQCWPTRVTLPQMRPVLGGRVRKWKDSRCRSWATGQTWSNISPPWGFQACVPIDPKCHFLFKPLSCRSVWVSFQLVTANHSKWYGGEYWFKKKWIWGKLVSTVLDQFYLRFLLDFQGRDSRI